MENQISLKKVLGVIHSKDERGNAVKFNVELREFSRQNSTGGKYKVYNEVCLLRRKNTTPLVKKVFFEERERKNPNHWKNRTRNLELPNGDIKTINILFIIKFNGKIVVY